MRHNVTFLETIFLLSKGKQEKNVLIYVETQMNALTTYIIVTKENLAAILNEEIKKKMMLYLIPSLILL